MFPPGPPHKLSCGPAAVCQTAADISSAPQRVGGFTAFWALPSARGVPDRVTTCSQASVIR